MQRVADKWQILAITGDSKRKSQEELISFITGKKFAVGRHPKISLMTFEYEEKEIDVIIINPKGYVPYYLEKAETDKKSGKNKTVNEGSIYTRVEDKNTPINSNASTLDTEILWIMHFGLYTSHIQRLN